MTWVEMVAVSSFVSALAGWCVRIWRGLVWGFDHLVPPAVQQLALEQVRNMANQELDNEVRRNVVLAHLERAGVSEHIARLAVELAVRVVKAEVATLTTPKNTAQ